MRFFFAAHGQGHTLCVIPGTGLLHNMAAAFNKVDLTLDFVLDRAHQSAERVKVFDLGAGTELGSAFRHDRDIGITAQTAFLHFAVADISIFQNSF